MRAIRSGEGPHPKRRDHDPAPSALVHGEPWPVLGRWMGLLIMRLDPPERRELVLGCSLLVREKSGDGSDGVGQVVAAAIVSREGPPVLEVGGAVLDRHAV
nr:hypothetical protein KitaXyl93_62370 [Kitasatospora sp. Xyl93]